MLNTNTLHSYFSQSAWGSLLPYSPPIPHTPRSHLRLANFAHYFTTSPFLSQGPLIITISTIAQTVVQTHLVLDSAERVLRSFNSDLVDPNLVNDLQHDLKSVYELLKPTEKVVARMGNLLTAAAIVHAVAAIYFKNSLPHVAFLAAYALSEARKRGYFPKSFDEPHQAFITGLMTLSNLTSKSLFYQLQGVSQAYSIYTNFTKTTR